MSVFHSLLTSAERNLLPQDGAVTPQSVFILRENKDRPEDIQKRSLGSTFVRIFVPGSVFVESLPARLTRDNLRG